MHTSTMYILPGESNRSPNRRSEESSKESDPFLAELAGVHQYTNSAPSWQRFLAMAYVLCLHFLLLGVWLLPDSSSSRLLSSELPFARDHIEYVDTTFLPSGFTKGPAPFNPYLGPPNADNDALWESLYDVGMVTITAEEAQQLRITTTAVVDSHAELDESQYVVTLEVFHQLHCLDYLRHASYNSDHHHGESEWSKTRHVDHCVDYLRQVLQCQGDMTPIALEAVPGVAALPLPNPPPYRPDFAIEHTCRNFELIYDFALQRNTSGYKVA